MTDANPSPLDNCSLDALRYESRSLAAEAAEIKMRQAALTAELTKRLGTAFRDELTAAGKTHGSMTKELPDGTKIKGEIKQTVKWDSNVLQALAGKMTWEQVKHFFKIDFSVSESMYKAIQPGELKNAMTAARTTKLGDVVVSFVEQTG